MRASMKIILLALAFSALSGTALHADVKKGQKYYLKTFKSKFKMNGVQFATLYTQDEWRELFENEGEGFKKEFIHRYPKAKKLLSKPKIWKKLEHVRDFAIEYAKDSGKVPSCG